MGGLGDDNLIRCCLLLQTRRHIGGVAHGRIVHAQVVPNRTDHDHAGVKTHPDGEFSPLGLILTTIVGMELASEFQGGEYSAPSVVLMGNRRPEECHEAVPQELINGAFIAMDGAQRQLKKLVQDAMHGLWPELFRQARVIRQVAIRARSSACAPPVTPHGTSAFSRPGAGRSPGTAPSRTRGAAGEELQLLVPRRQEMLTAFWCWPGESHAQRRPLPGDRRRGVLLSGRRGSHHRG